MTAISGVMRHLKLSGNSKNSDGSSRRQHDPAFVAAYRAQELGEVGDGEDNADDVTSRSSTRRKSEDMDKSGRKKADKERLKQFLRCLLRLTSVSLPNAAEGPFTIPLNHHRQVSGIIASDSRVMSSKQAPLWVAFQNCDGPTEDKVMTEHIVWTYIHLCNNCHV